MRAIIYQIEAQIGAGLLPVAGRPLIARQLQWLRAAGCEGAIVEICNNLDGDRIATWLAADGLGAFAEIVLTPRPLGAEEIAKRAGISGSVPFLAVPGDSLGGGDLTAIFRHVEEGGTLTLTPPPCLASLASTEIALRGRSGGPGRRADGPGWGVRISSVRDALAVGMVLASSELEEGDRAATPIHAAEIRPGVWVARGAHVSETATLTAPVLVGAGCYVGDGARVGPWAELGEGVIVEAGAVVERALVVDGIVVGEGSRVEGVLAGPGGRSDLDVSSMPPACVPGVVLAERPGRSPSFATRSLAAFALVVLAPFVLVRRLVRHALVTDPPTDGLESLAILLQDTARGDRTLLGVRARIDRAPSASQRLLDAGAFAPLGLIDIERALTAPGDDVVTRLRARAWYAEAKCTRVDRQLLVGTLRLLCRSRVGDTMTRPAVVPPLISSRGGRTV